MRSRMAIASPKKHDNIYLWLILVLGAILRIYKLGSQSFWYDEIYSANLSAKSLSEVALRFGQTPTLYHILLNFWLYLGRSDAMIRLLSAVFGVIALWVVYLVGKNLLDTKHGLLGAFLLAISPFHIWYSQEARMYSLLILLSSASMLFFIKFLKEKRGWPSVWWILTTVMAIYTHYHAAFILFCQVVFFLFFRAKYRSRWSRFGYSLGAMAIMVLPSFFLMFPGGQFDTAQDWALAGNPLRVFSVPYTFFAFSLGFSYGPSVAELHRSLSLATVRPYLTQVVPAFFLFSAIFVMGVRSLWREREQLAFLLLYLIVPIVGACLVSLLWPRASYNVRYVSAALTGFILILARGLLVPRYQIVRWTLMAFVLMVTLLSVHNHYYQEKYAKADYRSAAQFVRVHSELSDVILTTQVGLFTYYYRGPLVVHKLFWSPISYRQMIRMRVQGYQRAWMALSREWGLDPEGNMKDYMKRTFQAVKETTITNLYLGLFDLTATQED